jgi:hypothetical protein
MRSESVMASALMALALAGCARGNVHAGHDMEAASPSAARSGAAMSQMGNTTSAAANGDVDTARVRAATAAFRSRDAALAAGYAVKNPACVAHPSMGAMGYHLDNDALKDDHIEVDRPEVLVYRRTPAGEYELTGVEYMVPFSAHAPTLPPPTVMGQALKPFAMGKFWYLHVWAWTDNPAGLFADWNPRIAC